MGRVIQVTDVLARADTLYDHMREMEGRPVFSSGIQSLQIKALATALVGELNRVEAASEGWVEWKGGECPVPPETKVQIQFSDGDDDICVASRLWWEWKSGGSAGDIVAYRVIE